MTQETELKLWHWYAVVESGADAGYGVAQLVGRRGADGVRLVYTTDGFATGNTRDRLIGPIAGPGKPPAAVTDRVDAERMAREWATAEAADDPLRLAVEAMRAEGTAMQEKAVAEHERDEERGERQRVEEAHALCMRRASRAERERDEARRQVRTLAAALENVFECFPTPWDAGQFNPDSDAWSIEDGECCTITVREGVNHEGEPGPEAYTKTVAAAVNAGADLITTMAGGHAPAESAYSVILNEANRERDEWKQRAEEAERKFAEAHDDAHALSNQLREARSYNKRHASGPEPSGSDTLWRANVAAALGISVSTPVEAAVEHVREYAQYLRNTIDRDDPTGPPAGHVRVRIAVAVNEGGTWHAVGSGDGNARLDYERTAAQTAFDAVSDGWPLVSFVTADVPEGPGVTVRGRVVS